jgi:hypothetical protein
VLKRQNLVNNAFFYLSFWFFLSFCLSDFLFFCLSVFLVFFCLSVFLSVFLSIFLSFLSFCLFYLSVFSIFLSFLSFCLIYLSVFSIFLSFHLSVYVSIGQPLCLVIQIDQINLSLYVSVRASGFLFTRNLIFFY